MGQVEVGEKIHGAESVSISEEQMGEVCGVWVIAIVMYISHVTMVDHWV